MIVVIFQHEVNLNNVYCWNGVWPIAVTSGTEPWNGIKLVPQANGSLGPEPLTQKEQELFESLALSSKRTFTLKGRGKFNIIKRIGFKQ